MVEITWDIDRTYSNIGDSAKRDYRYRLPATWNDNTDAPYIAVKINNTSNNEAIEVLGAKFDVQDMIGSPYWPYYGINKDTYMCRTMPQNTFMSWFVHFLDEGALLDDETMLQNSLYAYVGKSQDMYYNVTGETTGTLESMNKISTTQTYPQSTTPAYYTPFIKFRKDSTKKSQYSTDWANDYYVLGGGTEISEGVRKGRYNALIIPAGSTDYVYIRFPKNYFNRYCVYVPVLYIRTKTERSSGEVYNPSDYPIQILYTGIDLDLDNKDVMQEYCIGGVFQVGNESGREDADLYNDASSNTLSVLPEQDYASGYARCTYSTSNNLGTPGTVSTYVKDSSSHINNPKSAGNVMFTANYLNVPSTRLNLATTFKLEYNTNFVNPPKVLTSSECYESDSLLTLGAIKKALNVNLADIEAEKYPSYTSGWNYSNPDVVDLCVIDRRTGKVNMISDRSNYCSTYTKLTSINPNKSEIYNIPVISTEQESRIIRYGDRVTPMYDYYWLNKLRHEGIYKSYSYSNKVQISFIPTGTLIKDNLGWTDWTTTAEPRQPVTQYVSYNRLKEIGTYKYTLKIDIDKGYTTYVTGVEGPMLLNYSDDGIRYIATAAYSKQKSTTQDNAYDIEILESVLSKHPYWRIYSTAKKATMATIKIYRNGYDTLYKTLSVEAYSKEEIEYEVLTPTEGAGYTGMYIQLQRKPIGSSEGSYEVIETYSDEFNALLEYDGYTMVKLSKYNIQYDYRIAIYDSYLLQIPNCPLLYQTDLSVIDMDKSANVLYARGDTESEYIICPYFDYGCVTAAVKISDNYSPKKHGGTYVVTINAPWSCQETDKFGRDADEFAVEKGAGYQPYTLDVDFRIYPLTGNPISVGYPELYKDSYVYKYNYMLTGTRVNNVVSICLHGQNTY